MSNASGIRAGRAYIELGIRENVAREITRVAAKLQGLGRSATMIGSAALGAAAGMGALLLKPLKLAANLEQTQAKFTTMLGSAEAAVQMLDFLKGKAAATPFELTDLQNATETLLNFGVDARKIPDALDALGNASGGNAERLKSLALVFGQVSANGRMTGQDLLQMVNAGFNPLQEIAKRTGETMEQLRDRMSDGAIGVDEVELAFISATGPGGRFFGLMDAQSKTLLGRFSALKDEIAATMLPIGTALAPLAMRVIESVAKMLPPLAQFFTENQKLIQGVAMITAVVAAGGIALIGFGAASMILGAAMSTLTVLIPAVISTVLSLRVAIALLVRPLGWLSVGLVLFKVALAGVAALMASGWIQRAVDQFNKLSIIIRQKLAAAGDALKEFGTAVYAYLSSPIVRIGRALMFLLNERQFASAAKLLGTAIALGIVTGLTKLATAIPAVMARLRASALRGIVALEGVSPRLATIARAALAAIGPLLTMATAMKVLRVAGLGLTTVLRVLAATLLTPWGLIIVAIGAVAAVVYRFGDQLGVQFDQVAARITETIRRVMNQARAIVDHYGGAIIQKLRSGDYAGAAAMAWQGVVSAIRSAVAIAITQVQTGFAAFKAAASSAAVPFAPLLDFVQRFATAVAADLAMLVGFAKRVGAFLVGLGKSVAGVLERFPWLGTVLGHVGVIVGVATVAIVALAGAIVFLTAPLVPLAAIVVKAAVALRTIWLAIRAVGAVTAIAGRGLWAVGGAARGAGGRIVTALRGIPSMLANFRARVVALLPLFRNFGATVLRLFAGGRWKAAAAIAGTAILIGIATGWRRLVEVVPTHLAKLKSQILGVAPWMAPVIASVTNAAKMIGGAYLLIGTFALGAGAWVVRFAQVAWEAMQGLPEFLKTMAQHIWEFVQIGFGRTVSIIQSLFGMLPTSVNNSMGSIGQMIGTAADWIGGTFNKLSSYVATVWAAMGGALMSGNFGLAAEIAMTEVQLVFLRATNWLKQMWAFTVYGMGSAFSMLADTVRDIFQTIVDWLAGAMLKAMGLIQALLQKASHLPGIGTKAAEAAASMGDMQQAVNELQSSNKQRDDQTAKDRAKRERERFGELQGRLANNQSDVSTVEKRRQELQAKAAQARAMAGGDNALANSLGNLGDGLRASLNQQLADVERAQAAADLEAANKKAAGDKLAKRSQLAGNDAIGLSKAQSVGSFSAAAANLLGGGNVQDKIAKATERAAKAGEATAKGVQQLAKKPEPALG